MNYRPDLMMSSKTLELVDNEIVAARRKFPAGSNLFPALVEEVGELARAFLQGNDRERVIAEAKHVAAMAIRIIEEGCPEFCSPPNETRKP